MALEGPEESFDEAAQVGLYLGEANRPLILPSPLHFGDDGSTIQIPALAAADPKAIVAPKGVPRFVHLPDVRRLVMKAQPLVGHIATAATPKSRKRGGNRLRGRCIGEREKDVGKTEHETSLAEVAAALQVSTR